MGNLKLAIALIFLSAVACGATFLLALYRQLALVEVAASLSTMVEVYLLSAAIGRLIEGQREGNFVGTVVALALATLIVTYFTVGTLAHH